MFPDRKRELVACIELATSSQFVDGFIDFILPDSRKRRFRTVEVYEVVSEVSDKEAKGISLTQQEAVIASCWR
jgi:hypothetical protein